MADPLQAWFMPWAGLRSPVSLGRATFWPWDQEATDRVRDAHVRNHLRRLFGSYVGHDGCPVDTVTVCSHGPTDFRVLDEAESGDVLRARDALFFASFVHRAVPGLCAGFRGLAPPTADVFTLVRQNFVPGDDSIAVGTRSLKTAGYKIGRLRFPKPFALGGGPNTPDPELTCGFDRALRGRARTGLVKRLLRALEWFRLAHVEEGEISELSRVVMMATAFEVFLDAYGKKELAQRVDGIVGHPGLPQSRRLQKSPRKWLSYSKPACWIWDFYNLRNAIVHGERVSSSRLVYSGRIMHINAAEILLWHLVKLDLFRHKLIGGETRRAAAKMGRVSGKAQAQEMAECMAKNDPVFRKVCEALGWLRPHDLSAYQEIENVGPGE